MKNIVRGKEHINEFLGTHLSAVFAYLFSNQYSDEITNLLLFGDKVSLPFQLEKAFEKGDSIALPKTGSSSCS